MRVIVEDRTGSWLFTVDISGKFQRKIVGNSVVLERPGVFWIRFGAERIEDVVEP